MPKNFEELEFTDSFMFSKIMYERTDLCQELLELFLQKKIEIIDTPVYEKTIQKRFDAKGVRLDVYVKDDLETVYDIEMQVRSNEDLPKRSRYYHDLIDLDLLGKGKNYSTLNNSYVIFICKRRPAPDYTEPVYTFRYQSQEHPEKYLEDGTWTIFINADCDESADMSSELKAFLAFVRTGKCFSTGEGLTERLHQAVMKGRLNEDWRIEYMTVEDWGNERYEEGRQKGLEEGREEERALTEKEKARADKAESRADKADALLAKYIEKYGKLES